MLAAIAAMIIASIAAPRAFGRDATTFADRVPDRPRPAPRALRDRGTRRPRASARRAAHRAIGVPRARRCSSLPVLWPRTAKLLCWGAAAAVDYLGPLIGHMRGWRLSPTALRRTLRPDHPHRARRVGRRHRCRRRRTRARSGPHRRRAARRHRRRVPLVVVLRLGRLRRPKSGSSRRPAHAARRSPVTPTRTCTSRMVGGIVLFAFGLETALHDTAASLAIVPAFGLVCGHRAVPPRPRRAPAAHRRRTRARATDRCSCAARVASRCDTRAGRWCAGHGRRSLRRAHRL